VRIETPGRRERVLFYIHSESMDCQAWPLPIRPDRARQIVGSSQTQHLPKGDTPTHFEMLLGNGQDPLIAPIAGLVARDVGTHILAEAPRFRKAKPLRAGPLGDKKKPLRQNLHHAAKGIYTTAPLVGRFFKLSG
jgi:hypothetical protein